MTSICGTSRGDQLFFLVKLKDNNASSAIGPFVRLFDGKYGIDDVRRAELRLTVSGIDGFELHGQSSMSMISRDPLDLVRQTYGDHHQYPDGFFRFWGQCSHPFRNRRAPGAGFTHEMGDLVTISETKLGTLQNTVALSTDCPAWVFGTTALMRNLADRGLI